MPLFVAGAGASTFDDMDNGSSFSAQLMPVLSLKPKTTMACSFKQQETAMSYGMLLCLENDGDASSILISSSRLGRLAPAPRLVPAMSLFISSSSLELARAYFILRTAVQGAHMNLTMTCIWAGGIVLGGAFPRRSAEGDEPAESGERSKSDADSS
jgi:hypothetical protein